MPPFLGKGRVMAWLQEAIRQEFARQPSRSITETAQRIEALTSIRRQPSQTRLFLKKLGLKFQRVRAVPVPPKKVSASM